MMSDQDYDAIKSNYESAESELNRASAARAVAEISYNEANIKAPISGTILTKAVEIGDLLSPYTTVVTMADLTSLADDGLRAGEQVRQDQAGRSGRHIR